MFDRLTRPSIGEVSRRLTATQDEMRRGFADVQSALSTKVVLAELYHSEQRDQDNRITELANQVGQRQGRVWALWVAVAGAFTTSLGGLITAIVLLPKH